RSPTGPRASCSMSSAPAPPAGARASACAKASSGPTRISFGNAPRACCASSAAPRKIRTEIPLLSETHSMIHGHLSAVDAYAHLLSNPAWRFAFDWLSKLPPRPEPGIRPLQGDDIYVNVHGYETLPREQCRYESHRRYVDL